MKRRILYFTETVACLLLSVVLTACNSEHTAEVVPVSQGDEITLEYARTFRVFNHGDYRVVDFRSTTVAWGGSAEGPELHQRIVLVPHDRPVPALVGELANSTVIRTPVRRIAVNSNWMEAIVTALGIEDRLVAAGGLKSYNDRIRQRIQNGEIGQVGYGWHKVANLDVLLASTPDVFVMALGDLGHANHMERIKTMGIPVVPVFLDNETDYMGKVEYIRLIGMLSGREQEADRYVDTIAANIDSLKTLAKSYPQKSVLYGWYTGNDVWLVAVRNAEGQLLRDANAVNLLDEGDDPHKDSFIRVGTETILERGLDADCFVMRDTHSVPFDDPGVLRALKAWKDNCLFASDGMVKPEFDAFDFYETAVIRPDLVLGDLIKMLHPGSRAEPYLYIQPDTLTPR